jgi:hypothetical protein
MALYYTDSFGSDRNAGGEALTRLLQLGQQIRQAAIASNQLTNFSEGTTIARVLEPAQYAEFNSKRALTLNGVKVFMMTQRDGASEFRRGPVMVLHGSPGVLRKVTNDPRTTDVIYVPWTEDERDEFKKNNPNAVAIPFTPDPGD